MSVRTFLTDILMRGNRIRDVGAPVQDGDAANKKYVDDNTAKFDLLEELPANVSLKPDVVAATTANITLSGTQTIDSVSVGVGDRVLVKGQSTASQNGIYTAAAGAWTRTTDADTWDELIGYNVVVAGGGQKGTLWTSGALPYGTLGTTAVTWKRVALASNPALVNHDMNGKAIIGLPETWQTPPADPPLWEYIEGDWFNLPDQSAATKGLLKVLLQAKLDAGLTSASQDGRLVVAKVPGYAGTANSVYYSPTRLRNETGGTALGPVNRVVLNTDVATKQYVDDSTPQSAYNTSPIGSILHWAGKTNPPADYVLLDGRTLTQAAYPQGFTHAQNEVAAGNTDWSVSGTNFTIPDYRNRFIYSSGAKAVTTKGGSETHTLATTEIPAHSHGIQGELPGAGGTASVVRVVFKNPGAGNWALEDATSPIYGGGGGLAHNNMPPYVTLAMFVKLKGITASENVVVAPTVVTQEGWHTVGAAGEPAFGTNWSPFVPAGYTAPAFRKDPAGKVALRGLLRNSATAGSSVMFTLPAGYRPVSNLLFACAHEGGPSIIVEVRADGTVMNNTGMSGLDRWIDLSTIEFDTGQTTFPAGKSVIPVVTSLPVGPTDGDEVYLQSAAMADQGVVWHLRYRSAATGSYKWEFVGGGDLFHEVVTASTVASTSYADISGSVGPQITLPVAGDYDVEIGASFYTSTPGTEVSMSYSIGATAASAADQVSSWAGATSTYASTASHARTRRKTGLGAVALTSKYTATTAGVWTVRERWMRVRPIRVG